MKIDKFFVKNALLRIVYFVVVFEKQLSKKPYQFFFST